MGWIGCVTNAGAALLDQWALGGQTLSIIKATTGSGTVSEINLRSQTSISNEVGEAGIVTSERVSGGVRYSVQIVPIASAYTMKQCGIWAKLGNGNNTLLAIYQNTDGVSIPSQSESPDFVYRLVCAIGMDNSGDLRVTIDTGAIVSQSQMAAALALKAETALYSVSLTSSGWSRSSSSDPYTQTVSVSGILATDNPLVDVDTSGATVATYDSIIDAWNCVGAVVTSDGSITAKCFGDAPNTNITMLVRVIR